MFLPTLCCMSSTQATFSDVTTKGGGGGELRAFLELEHGSNATPSCTLSVIQTVESKHLPVLRMGI